MNACRKAAAKLANQYPCACRSDGELALLDDFRTAVGQDTADPLALPDPRPFDETLREAGVTVTGQHDKKTSHGKVLFGVHDASSTKLAIKLMELDAASTTLKATPIVEALVGWVGSRMVEKQLSLGFPLVMGTFVVTYDGGTSLALVMEQLGAGLSKRLGQILGKTPADIDWQALVALCVQVALIAAQGQHVLKLVHNDQHLGNLRLGTTPLDDIRLETTPGGRVVVVPCNQERVVAIDFGRASIQSRLGRGAARIESSELQKFTKWNRSSFGADMMHFVAMLVLTQPTSRHIERGAAAPGAPKAARALVALMKASLTCPSLDMYKQYVTCHRTMRKTGCKTCARKAIHELRGADARCAGTTPQQWLTDADLLSTFRAETRHGGDDGARAFSAAPVVSSHEMTAQ